MRWKSTIVEAWKDPVWSKVIAGLILAVLGSAGLLLKELGSWLMNLNWGDQVAPIVEWLASILDFPVPLWFILFAGVSMWFLFPLMRGLVSRKRQKMPNASSASLPKRLESTGAVNRQLFGESIDAQILQSPAGTIAVWAKVNDAHNKIGSKALYRYIIAYAGNNGENLNNPSFARYPNAWSIVRITPSSQHSAGYWRFTTNAMKRDEATIIQTSEPISTGWRLFSVAWSKGDGFIRFAIDDHIIDQVPFEHWPSDTGGSFAVGTWAKDHSNYRFDSTVGPVYTLTAVLEAEQLKALLKEKPEG